jgi:hypothetical protein
MKMHSNREKEVSSMHRLNYKLNKKCHLMKMHSNKEREGTKQCALNYKLSKKCSLTRVTLNEVSRLQVSKKKEVKQEVSSNENAF